jgi:hypothetical protein
VRAEHDRRAQQVEPQLGVRGGFLGQQALDLGLLLRVEQVRGRADRPVLGHRHRVVAVKAVRRDRRGVDEALRPRGGRRAECVQRPLDVDRADRLAARRAGDHERQVHDHVGAGERLLERIGVAHVALAVGHLRPAVL